MKTNVYCKEPVKRFTWFKKILFILIALTITILVSTKEVHTLFGDLLESMGIPVKDVHGELNIMGIIIHTIILFVFLTYILHVQSS